VLIGVELFGREVFIHADVGGVQVTPRDRFLRNNRIVAEFETRWEMPEDLLKVAVEHIGDKYDYVAFLGFLWPVMLWRWFHVKTQNPLASARGMVCSEFAARIDPDGLVISEFKGIDPENTKPEDLLEICMPERSLRRLS
jgi:hypothetical protein